MSQELLNIITELSHEFGTDQFVRGGGGNTSVKTADTLWVKPSGTTLAGMKPETFVAMNRAKINELYGVESPSEASAREELVKNMMAAAVLPDSSGRPSVEAPLHNTFEAVYVVHTHPASVNGMTCANKGAETCARLFPEALWVPYTDPGYTLCMKVRDDIAEYVKAKGAEPQLVFMENHGVFVAADTPEGIREIYAKMVSTLEKAYQEAGVSMELEIGFEPDPQMVEDVTNQLRQTVGEPDAAYVTASGNFEVAQGPISPDHIVYSKSYPLVGEPTQGAVDAFKADNGYSPRVVATSSCVFGLGTTEKNARLALEFAQDGSLVMQLAEAFGGIQFMTDRARDFIDNWEVEAYRRKQAESEG